MELSQLQHENMQLQQDKMELQNQLRFQIDECNEAKQKVLESKT